MVANSQSGSSRPAEELLALAGPELELRLYEVAEGRSPTACARQAVLDGAAFVVAAGGDGTVSGVAAALVGGDVPMGILPLGTANSVAHALGIPDDLHEAARLWVEGSTRRIDTAVANGRTMVLLASVGMHASAIAEAPAEQKRTWGSLAYLLTGIRLLGEREPFRLNIELPTERIECRASAITIVNLAPTQTITAQGPSVIRDDDGRLDATILAADTLTQAVASGLHLLRTSWSNSPADRDDIGFFSTQRLRVTADPPQLVLIDGEEAGTTPLEVYSRPGSLVVIAPASQQVEKPFERKLEGLPDLKVSPRVQDDT